MKKGLMTVKSTGAEMVGVFFDKEAIECNRLNIRTKQRLKMRQKAKEEKLRFKQEMERNANHILLDVAIGGAVALAGTSGLIHPAIWVSTAVVCLCAACVRVGLWFGKAANK